MRDSICAPQVLVHLVHFSMSSCAYRITTSSDGLAVANGSALSARTHAQWLLGALAGNTPRRLWSTRNRTRGKIQRREARPLPAEHRRDHVRVSPTVPVGPLEPRARISSEPSAPKQHAYSKRCSLVLRSRFYLIGVQFVSVVAACATMSHVNSTALGRARGHRGHAGGEGDLLH